jgi:S-adenosylmethionine:diacylglycerol 3-amino-3-carboxypropyl transferase
MYEDWAVEAAIFPSSGRVFTIASAGCTSIALASRGLEVTAVDINPAQLDYARARLEGAPSQQGTADRLFALGRRLLPLAGVGAAALREFLSLEDPVAQLALWRRRFDTARFRAALATLLHPLALRHVYDAPFLKVLPPRFDRVMRTRLERCFGRHPNRSNPYAWRLFLGIDPPDQPVLRRSGVRVEWIEADAAAYLENGAPGQFVAFSLSNILDGTEPSYAARLMTAVRRSARPGAVMVIRSFGEPPPGEPNQWTARDRSMIWGVVRVERLNSTPFRT